MRDRLSPQLAKWPFFVGDALMLGLAWFIYARGSQPLGGSALGLMTLCVLAGAGMAMLPFVLEYRAAVKIAEAGALTSVVSQIAELTKIAEQISGATSRWQVAQEAADQTADAARAIAERMTAEVQGFKEFMKGANETEKATLRLEVEKLRRAEQDWLQVIVRMLDHVFALHRAAVETGQPRLIEQITRFQLACHEAARRVGLVPFVVEPGEAFNAEKHQWAEGKENPPPNASVAETVATGYRFQGRLLRPPLVRLQASPASPPDAAAEDSAAGNQAQLPLANAPETPGT
jgi:molecular chaperone GrpE (heat shock protein)